MATDYWTYDIEEVVASLLQADLATVIGGQDPTQTAIPPDYEISPRHDGDLEESQLPQSKNGVWFRCIAGEDIGQINGSCNRTNHRMEMTVWTLAEQFIDGEEYPNPLSAGRRFHGKTLRAIQKVLEDSSTGLPGQVGVYWCRKQGDNVPVTAKPGWTQCLISRMNFLVRQRTFTGRGA
tara:strand:+ start:8420 stop:8956 length:537 start_codon:yes stop_codon:yes gene_type:complete